MPVDAYNESVQAIQALVNKLIGGGEEGRQAALEYSQDPDGLLAEQGITDADLSGLDMRQLVADCAEGANLPPNTQQALQSYTSGGGSSYPVATPPAASHSAADVVQHLNYVTYATYEGDEHITQQLINYEDNSTTIDNSVEVDVDGDFEGDLDIDTTNVNATGEGAVAAGDDAEGIATGDGAVAAGDDIEDSQVNTGDGAVLVDGDLEAPVNTGTFTGVQTEGDVENVVVGDDNQTVQGEVRADVINFGGGSTISNIEDSTIDDAAISVGGEETTNVSDNELEEGSALSGTGDAEGSFEETEVDAEDSFVVTEQGPGDQEQEDNELEEVAGA